MSTKIFFTGMQLRTIALHYKDELLQNINIDGRKSFDGATLTTNWYIDFFLDDVKT